MIQVQKVQMFIVLVTFQFSRITFTENDEIGIIPDTIH